MVVSYGISPNKLCIFCERIVKICTHLINLNDFALFIKIHREKSLE